METKKTEQTSLFKKVVVVFGLALVTYFLVNYMTNQRFEDLEAQTRLLIADQETILVSIAETTARNGADAVTESIVRDCPIEERAAFDTLLGSLDNNLNQTQLVELERLFGRCGSFYAERKSVMVARLAREIEVYEAYVAQLGAIVNKDVSDSFQLEQWQQLSVAEQKLGALSTELVLKQDNIIKTLLAGNSPQSSEIEVILREVNEIQETLAVTNQQVGNLRSELVSL